ncbi:MAG: hypothetical protein ACXQS2_04510, partial [Methermicoccaceae archaeon]
MKVLKDIFKSGMKEKLRAVVHTTPGMTEMPEPEEPLPVSVGEENLSGEGMDGSLEDMDVDWGDNIVITEEPTEEPEVPEEIEDVESQPTTPPHKEIDELEEKVLELEERIVQAEKQSSQADFESAMDYMSSIRTDVDSISEQVSSFLLKFGNVEEELKKSGKRIDDLANAIGNFSEIIEYTLLSQSTMLERIDALEGEGENLMSRFDELQSTILRNSTPATTAPPTDDMGIAQPQPSYRAQFIELERKLTGTMGNIPNSQPTITEGVTVPLPTASPIPATSAVPIDSSNPPVPTYTLQVANAERYTASTTPARISMPPS